MKKTFLLMALLVAGSAQAGTHTEFARVIRSTPIYERSITETCTDVPVTRVQESSPGDTTAGAIVGGVLGGVIGHQFGGGRGKDVATVAGAIAGTMAGRSVAEQPRTSTTYQRECQQQPQSNLVGYSVTYDFHGEQNTIRMPYDPGNRLEMRVTVDPVIR